MNRKSRRAGLRWSNCGGHRDIGILIALLLPAVQKVREAGQPHHLRQQSASNCHRYAQLPRCHDALRPLHEDLTSPMAGTTLYGRCPGFFVH